MAEVDEGVVVVVVYSSRSSNCFNGVDRLVLLVLLSMNSQESERVLESLAVSVDVLFGVLLEAEFDTVVLARVNRLKSPPPLLDRVVGDSDDFVLTVKLLFLPDASTLVPDTTVVFDEFELELFPVGVVAVDALLAAL